jgi:hypothetical protein
MYLSHKYKFLFLRTPKTASSSLSDFFINNIDDPSAIYTEVEDANIPGTLSEDIVGKYRPYAFYHFTISQLIAEGVLTLEQAKEYKVFSVLRDPVDRAKSFYYFYKKFRDVGTPPSIEQYRNWCYPETAIFNNDNNSGIQQMTLSVHNNELLGDFWLYENLNKEVARFMDSLGLPNAELPQHKTGLRKNVREEIQFEQKDLQAIKNTFSADVEMYRRLVNPPIKWERNILQLP